MTPAKTEAAVPKPKVPLNPYKVYMVAGEASGDRYAAELTYSLKKLNPKANVYGVGGVHLRDAGQKQLFDLASHAVVGLTDVLRNYFKFSSFFKQVVEDIQLINPDVLVLIDYPGFNLRLAKKIRRVLPNLPIVYYISPQVWAWKRHRSKMMAEVLDMLLVIFPFEKDWFAKHQPSLHVQWVGHPLLDRWSGPAQNIEGEHAPRIALMPGSREKEIYKHLPILLETANKISRFIPGVRFSVLATGEESRKRIDQWVRESDARKLNIEVLSGYQLTHLSRSDLALVASGTATVECCVAGVPMMVLYKVHALTYWVGRIVVKLPYIGMVNVLAREKIVPEFIQEKASAEYLAEAVRKLFVSPRLLATMKANLKKVAESLGKPGAGDRAAQAILNLLDSRNS